MLCDDLTAVIRALQVRASQKNLIMGGKTVRSAGHKRGRGIMSFSGVQVGRGIARLLSDVGGRLI
jgi:hypothetical protein